MSRTCHIIVVSFLCLLLAGCAKSRIEVAASPDIPAWQMSKNLSYAYERATNRADRLKLSKLGIEYGETCIQETPDNPACYYYHAINTGLYYKSKVIGYQRGLKAMVLDCHKINDIDPTYDHGAGYRLLGQLFTEVPAASFQPQAIVRDLDKAIDYLNRAMMIDPNYPETLLAFAAAYERANREDEAAELLIKAKDLLPEWKDHPDYSYWKKTSRRLSKKVRKEIKALQSAN